MSLPRSDGNIHKDEPIAMARRPVGFDRNQRLHSQLPVHKQGRGNVRGFQLPADKVDKLEVNWPGGGKETFPVAGVDRVQTIIQGKR